jgi:hypothetical protein
MAQETTAQERTVRYGVDGGKLAEFVDYARENPDDVQFELRADGYWEGRAFHTLSKVGPYSLGGRTIDRETRDYTFPFGAHKEVEAALGFVDPDDRPEVIETALAALSGCLNHVISLHLVSEGLDVETLETRVRIPWSPFVALDIEDADAEDGRLRDQYGDLEIEISVGGENVSDETLERVRLAARRSAVYNLIALPHPAEPTVEGADPDATA